MKRILLFLNIVAVVLAFSSCDKAKDLAVYNNGSAINLSASQTTIAPPASDSSKLAVSLNWSSPNFATDSTKWKFIVQVDSAGKNFSNPDTRTVSGNLYYLFIAKDLNTLLINRGYAIGVPVDMDVRVIGSYANNNDRVISNTVRLRVTPYVVPPKIAVPSSGHLFLVGDATQGGWSNPVPVPDQEFAKISNTDYAGIFYLNGGAQYLALPVNGDWSHKYSVQTTGLPGLAAGGDFGYDLPSNFPGPATTGWYRIEFNFQTGKFIVTPYTGTLPTNLFIVGDATAGGWNNPVPTPSQQLTRVNSSVWTITMTNWNANAQYLLLPVNGDWSHKYAVANNTIPGLSAGGEFGYDLGANFPGPATGGTHTLMVNFAAQTTGAGSSGVFKLQ